MAPSARSASLSCAISPSSSAACGSSSGTAGRVSAVVGGQSRAVCWRAPAETAQPTTPEGPAIYSPDSVWCASIVMAKVVSMFSMRRHRRCAPRPGRVGKRVGSLKGWYSTLSSGVVGGGVGKVSECQSSSCPSRTNGRPTQSHPVTAPHPCPASPPSAPFLKPHRRGTSRARKVVMRP